MCISDFSGAGGCMPVFSQNISAKGGVGPVLAESGEICIRSRCGIPGQWGLLFLYCLSSFFFLNSSAVPVFSFFRVNKMPASTILFPTYSFTNNPFPHAETVNSACFLLWFLSPFSKIFPLKGIMPFKPGI